MKRLVASVTATALFAAQLALPTAAGAAYLGSSTISAGSAPPPAATNVQNFQPDLFTGRASTSIAIVVPPGRKGMQPSPALTYSSSDGNGWVGVGWDLDAGYIERSTKNGVPKYILTDDMPVFVMQGVASDLIAVGGNFYRAKDETLFFRFEYRGVSGWEARDKSGTRYLFGGASGTEITTASGTFRWCLRKVIDTNGNFLALSYETDGGNTYLSRIDYTGHETGGITDLAPANSVVFSREPRPDIDASYRSGAEIRTTQRLKTITVNAQGALVRKYVLGYSTSQRTRRSLLTSVTHYGSDGQTAYPPATFRYTDVAAPAFSITSGNTGSSNNLWNVRLATGTTLIDLGSIIPNSNSNTWYWFFNFLLPCYANGWLQPDGQFSCGTSGGFMSGNITWSSPSTQPSGQVGSASWSTAANGNIQFAGVPAYFGAHAWTYVYAATARQLSIASTNYGKWALFVNGARAGSLGSYTTTSPTTGTITVNINPGFHLLELTFLSFINSGSFNLNYPLASNVNLMSSNSTLSATPQLMGDFNGDGTSDVARFVGSGGMWKVARSDQGILATESDWLSGFGDANSTAILGDWDGDGKTDIAAFVNGTFRFGRSTGAAFTQDAWPALTLANGTAFAGDFNGDGKTDVGTFSNGAWQTALFTGSGFVSAWSANLGTSGSVPLTGDFNGDGLTDIAVANGGSVSVALSNGSAFLTQPSNWIDSFGSSQFTADLNGDGKTDIAYYDRGSGNIAYAPSSGLQFDAGQPGSVPTGFSLRESEAQPQVGELNGDGLVDVAVFNSLTGRSELALSQGATPDLLLETANGLGGTTTLSYRPSTQLPDTLLPFVAAVVTEAVTADGMGNGHTAQYHYSGGRYAAASREFRGFARVEVRDAEQNTTVTEFHQDDSKRGRPFRTQVQDAGGNLWSLQEQTWSVDTSQPAGVNFVRLDQADRYVYDGDATFRHSRSRFQYDLYGNLIRANEDGFVADPSPGARIDLPTDGDERSTVTTYNLNAAEWILSKPKRIETLAADGTTMVAQRRFYYDGAASIDATAVKGNLTKEEEWLKGATDRWLPMSLTYDAYGNVLTVTDPLLRITTNTYDSTQTYLSQIKNHLNQTRQLVHDARFGQVTSSTDQNSQTTATEYDVFGRIAKIIGPNDTAALPTISYQHDLSSVPPSRTVANTRVVSGQTKVLPVYSFTDGLGRIIQTRSPAEDSAKQIVSGTVQLDNRGLVTKQWVPYLDSLSASYVAPPVASLAAPVEYEYDPVGRLTKTMNPDGTQILISHDDGETTTRVAGEETRRLLDAYGRLIRVQEVASPAETYTTLYAYNPLDNLTQVTNHAGYATHISYDSLGRKVSMDDPDTGHWLYTYDDANNLKTQVDARGVTITFTYDALNRLTQKNYTTPAGSGIANPGTVTYTFDTPNAAEPHSKGKLTKVVDGSGTSTFQYDKLGRLTRETKTIGTANYPVQRAYDLLGRLTSLTYPDNETAAYTYNDQNGIETITLGPQSIVADMTYNAAGQITKVVHGNGVTTDYSYNPQTLRLQQLRTVGPAGDLQNYTYAFDGMGNISGITGFARTPGNALNDMNQSFTYDTLSRLATASGPYGNMAYAHDPLGNMTQKEGVTLRYGENGYGPHAVTSTSSGWQLQYDANGNMAQKTTPANGTTLFRYDAANNLVETAAGAAAPTTTAITLAAGWNFFSLASVPANASLASVFSGKLGTDIFQVSRWDAATQQWEHATGDAEFDRFSTLEYGRGYEVFVANPAGVTVTVTGTAPSSPVNIPLSTGFNLIGTPSAQPIAAAEALGGLQPNVDYRDILGYSQSTFSPLSTGALLQPGKSYFLDALRAATWNAAGTSQSATQFVYDGDGARVKQVTAAGTTTFLGELVELTSTATTKYVFAGSQRIAAKSSAGGLLFYHTDHLGSNNTITNGSGAVVEHTEHLPYGAVSLREGSVNLPHKFTGQRQDAATGLILFSVRAYDPQLGRFIQPDPTVQRPHDPQDLNRYTYCRNNPVNLVDPTGYGWLRKLFAAIAAVVVTVVTGHAELGAAAYFAVATAAVVAADQAGALIERSFNKSAASSPAAQAAGAPGASAAAQGQLLHAKTGQPITPEEAAYLGKMAGEGRLPIFINGILTTKEGAMAQAERVGALVVFYNPSAGSVADLSESAISKWLGPTSIDRALQQTLDRIAAAGVPVDITAYSQGTLIATSALAAGAQLAESSTVTLKAAAVSSRRAGAVARSARATLDYTPTKFLDPINTVQDLNPVKMFGGTIGLVRDLATGSRYSAHRLDNYVSQASQ